jgi:hypothetical protein
MCGPRCVMDTMVGEVGKRGSPVLPLTSRPVEDTVTKSCPIGRSNGLQVLGGEDAYLSMGNERPNDSDTLSLRNDRPKGILSLGNDRPNGTPSLGNDRPNGTLSSGNDHPNGALSLGNDHPNGALSLGNDRPNGTLSLENDRRSGVLSMGEVCSSWQGGVGGVLTLGKDTTTSRPNRDPTLDYVVRYLDSD